MSQQNVEVVRRWWAAFNKDGTPPLELCHERIEMGNPASFPNRGPYRGHDGVHERMADTWDVIDGRGVEGTKSSMSATAKPSSRCSGRWE